MHMLRRPALDEPDPGTFSCTYICLLKDTIAYKQFIIHTFMLQTNIFYTLFAWKPRNDGNTQSATP